LNPVRALNIHLMKVELKRVNQACHFEASSDDGTRIDLDSSAESLGEGAGVRPMQSLLMALGACTAIDVTLIMNKQRLLIEDFHLTVEGSREENKEPSLWESIHIHYNLKGQLPLDKVHRAIELSMEKYCSVAETLRRAGAGITYSFEVTA